MKIQELLSDESKWTKGANARDKDGNAVIETMPQAAKWCLVGAASKCSKCSDQRNTILTIASALGFNAYEGHIVDWNDSPERTFAEVRALIEKLDI